MRVSLYLSLYLMSRVLNVAVGCSLFVLAGSILSGGLVLCILGFGGWLSGLLGLLWGLLGSIVFSWSLQIIHFRVPSYNFVRVSILHFWSSFSLSLSVASKAPIMLCPSFPWVPPPVISIIGTIPHSILLFRVYTPSGFELISTASVASHLSVFGTRSVTPMMNLGFLPLCMSTACVTNADLVSPDSSDWWCSLILLYPDQLDSPV